MLEPEEEERAAASRTFWTAGRRRGTGVGGVEPVVRERATGVVSPVGLISRKAVRPVGETEVGARRVLPGAAVWTEELVKARPSCLRLFWVEAGVGSLTAMMKPNWPALMGAAVGVMPA
jgi:hypothetical protein